MGAEETPIQSTIKCKYVYEKFKLQHFSREKYHSIGMIWNQSLPL